MVLEDQELWNVLDSGSLGGQVHYTSMNVRTSLVGGVRGVRGQRGGLVTTYLPACSVGY